MEEDDDQGVDDMEEDCKWNNDVKVGAEDRRARGFPGTENADIDRLRRMLDLARQRSLQFIALICGDLYTAYHT